LERPPRSGHRKARDLRNDRAQPDMTQTFLKAIEDRLLVAAFEIDDRSDFGSAWARAGAKRSGRSRHHRTFPSVRAAIPATKRAAAAPSIAPLPPPATSCSAPSARPPAGSRASISASPNGNAVVTRRRRSSIRRTWPRRTSMSDGGRADLMELLGWRFEYVRYLFLERFPESSPARALPPVTSLGR